MIQVFLTHQPSNIVFLTLLNDQNYKEQYLYVQFHLSLVNLNRLQQDWKTAASAGAKWELAHVELCRSQIC